MLPDNTLPLFERAGTFRNHLAVIDNNGGFTYDNLLTSANKIAAGLLGGEADLNEARIAFLVPPGFEYVAVQWGIWLAGGIAVPLCLTHPLPEMEYVLMDTGAETIVVHPDYIEKLRPLLNKLKIENFTTKNLIAGGDAVLPQLDMGRRAMILYTSGTTSKPKGVVLTHSNIQSQITTLTGAWGWTATDHILHTLPLHHTHGIVNALLCALWSGATCEMLPKFDAEVVWQHFQAGDVSLFMAVPTIYYKLVSAWEEAAPADREKMSAGAKNLRLMVSGSAALPVSIFEKWRKITGRTLLERYGMTEIGMALSNPLHGDRRAGYVGMPLPGVIIRLVDETGKEITREGTPGEIQVKGPNVFKEYWNKPEATRQAFKKGWFCTGDIAIVEDGYYKILGRSSVDIIKSGGYKISALEIEEVLRTHPDIRECAVVGVADPEWGERIAAAVIPGSGKVLTLEKMQLWAKQRLAGYKIPRQLLLLKELPRNAMGKVTKQQVRKMFEKS